MSTIYLNQIDVILLDVEGTTTPIDFVYGQLFPYVRSHLLEFLQQGMDTEDLTQVELEYQAETANSLPPWEIPPYQYLLWLMDQDRKSLGLKSIQGKICQAGYADGSLRGVLFPDVFPALQHWSQKGIRIFIYSSGSVLAQKLIFTNSNDGDVTPWIEGYFDTEVGSKKEVESYRAIAKRIEVVPERCLFISDSVAECLAANKAGFQVLHSIRPGNHPETSLFVTISSFDNI
jgi:enolase-phosphatase E1